ncbi:DUF6538 domain-containing protein [Duganella sp. sic0402]|uniref:DUF6538 domain-containing protein n=1 Tax=Duganella sp. sic0402 TaxID=2854786 RepID=UPI0035A3D18F
MSALLAWCCTRVPHMAGKFLIKSRHGTIYYFRRRIPEAARHAIGRQVFVQSLETSDRRLAVVRGRALAAQTDSIFQRIAMATNSNDSDGFTFNYEMKLDFNELGLPSSLYVKAEPHEEGAVNSAIRTALAGKRGHSSIGHRPRRPKALQRRHTRIFQQVPDQGSNQGDLSQ